MHNFQQSDWIAVLEAPACFSHFYQGFRFVNLTRSNAAALGSGERSFREWRDPTSQAAEAQSVHLAETFSENVRTARILQQQRQVLFEQERTCQHQQQPQ